MVSNRGVPVMAADVVGQLCTPLDVIARNLELPHIEIGDVIAVLQSGAYGRSASPLGFFRIVRQLRCGRLELSSAGTGGRI